MLNIDTCIFPKLTDLYTCKVGAFQMAHPVPTITNLYPCYLSYVNQCMASLGLVPPGAVIHDVTPWTNSLTRPCKILTSRSKVYITIKSIVHNYSVYY